MIRPLYYFIKDKNYAEFYKLLAKYGSLKRYTPIKNVKFKNYTIDIPDGPSFVFQFKEIFVEEIYKFESDTDSPIIYDCGANIGMSCLYFKSIYPKARIKVFEADPIIVEILKKNLLRNDIKDVEIIDKAVWIDYNGVYLGIEGADGGSIKLNSDKKIKVDSIRLKDFLESEYKVHFLKIDIEGAEYEVLKDCKDALHNVENIFIEYHSWKNSPQKLSEILAILENNGFRYYIENVNKRKNPFVNHGEELNMDLQLNIFGVRCG